MCILQRKGPVRTLRAAYSIQFNSFNGNWAELTITALISVGATIFNGLSDIANVPVAVNNVKSEVDGLRVILTSLNDMLTVQPSPISNLPQGLQEALAGNLKGLMKVKLQLLEALKSYLQNKPERWLPSLLRRIGWVLGGEKDVEKLRKNLENHKGTLGLTLMVMSK